jgi:hypothetical protein
MRRRRLVGRRMTVQTIESQCSCPCGVVFRGCMRRAALRHYRTAQHRQVWGNFVPQVHTTWFFVCWAAPHKKIGLIKRTWTFRHTFSRPNSGPSDAHPVYSALNRRRIRRHSPFLIIRPSPSRPQCIAHITVTRAMSNSIDP